MRGFAVLKEEESVAQGAARISAVCGVRRDRVFLGVQGRMGGDLAKTVLSSIQQVASFSPPRRRRHGAVAIGLGRHRTARQSRKEVHGSRGPKDDVPDQNVPGLPVSIDHKIRTELVEHVTDARGRARFEG